MAVPRPTCPVDADPEPPVLSPEPVGSDRVSLPTDEAKAWWLWSRAVQRHLELLRACLAQ